MDGSRSHFPNVWMMLSEWVNIIIILFNLSSTLCKYHQRVRKRNAKALLSPSTSFPSLCVCTVCKRRIWTSKATSMSSASLLDNVRKWGRESHIFSVEGQEIDVFQEQNFYPQKKAGGGFVCPLLFPSLLTDWHISCQEKFGKKRVIFPLFLSFSLLTTTKLSTEKSKNTNFFLLLISFFRLSLVRPKRRVFSSLFLLSFRKEGRKISLSGSFSILQSRFISFKDQQLLFSTFLFHYNNFFLPLFASCEEGKISSCLLFSVLFLSTFELDCCKFFPVNKKSNKETDLPLSDLFLLSFNWYKKDKLVAFFIFFLSLQLYSQTRVL